MLHIADSNPRRRVGTDVSVLCISPGVSLALSFQASSNYHDIGRYSITKPSSASEFILAHWTISLLNRSYTGGRRPAIKNISARTKPTTNRIQAIFTAVPAIPENPNSAAMIAIIKNVTAQLIMLVSFGPVCYLRGLLIEKPA